MPDHAPPADGLELIEVVNLPEADTGIGGIIDVSAAQGSHGPRVKWFPGRPGRGAPCLTVTVAAEPAVANNGLPSHVAQAAAGRVVDWVRTNRAALADFWDNGVGWTRQEVAAFADRLQKL